MPSHQERSQAHRPIDRVPLFVIYEISRRPKKASMESGSRSPRRPLERGNSNGKVQYCSTKSRNAETEKHESQRRG